MKQTWLVGVRIWLMVQLAVLIGVTAQPALAHTEDAVMQLSLEPVGPYAMTVWTYPGIMRAGSVHYTVAVEDTAVAQPLNNATVIITATPLDGAGEPVSGQAWQGVDKAYPTFYELDLVLSEKGVYHIDVQLKDKSGQTWTKNFQVEVVSATFMKWLILVLLVQALAFALWLLRESVQTWGLQRLFVRNSSDWEKTRTRTKRPS